MPPSTGELWYNKCSNGSIWYHCRNQNGYSGKESSTPTILSEDGGGIISMRATIIVVGTACMGVALALLSLYATQGTEAQASLDPNLGPKLLPPMTMVYETDGPVISVGNRHNSYRELRRLEYQSETQWTDTVIEAPDIDLGRYGMASRVGSYTRLDGRSVTEFDTMTGDASSEQISEEDGVLLPVLSFGFLIGGHELLDATPELRKSHVATDVKVCVNSECESNVGGLRYRTGAMDLVVWANDSWSIPIKHGDRFVVKDLKIHGTVNE